MQKINPTVAYNGFNAITYFILSIWCALRPEFTSDIVGLSLIGDRGYAEFSAVYGGIEFGFALYFLFGVLRRRHQESVLIFAIFLYGAIVFFRGYMILTHGAGLGMGWFFAVSEWALFAWGLYAFKLSYGDKASKGENIFDADAVM